MCKKWRENAWVRVRVSDQKSGGVEGLGMRLEIHNVSSEHLTLGNSTCHDSLIKECNEYTDFTCYSFSGVHIQSKECPPSEILGRWEHIP